MTFILIGIVLLLLLGLSLAIFFLLSRQKSIREKINAQTLELKHQQDLLDGNLRVQEEERQRIAAQLHDDVCSKLGVMHLTFHRLRRTEPTNGQYAEMCDEINELIGETLTITRRISHELVPPTLEGFGLLEALEELCEQIRNTGAVDIRFEHDLSRSDLGNDVSLELNLFRIVQELANNSLKHADASFITLELQKEDDFIQLIYCDNGIGFNPKNNHAKGLGLKNIYNRAKMVGAAVQLSTAPEQGFEMRFSMPATPPPPQPQTLNPKP
ncbi:MAG: histidine kinase [Saprospiraceae bacterium]|nr:histidine kinase [Saprospiraceae bacterium]